MLFDRWGFRLQAPEGEGAGGGSGSGKPDVAAAARRKLDKDRNATRVVTQLMEENYEQREEIRRLKTQAENAVPKGSVVLSGEESKLWEKLKGLGKPEDVERMLKEHPELVKYKADTESTSATRNVARAMGWNPDVLVDITTARGLEFKDEEITVRDAATGKDEKKRVPHVRAKAVKDAKFEPLEEYGKRELTAYTAALQVKSNGTGGSSTAVEYPAQPSHDQGSGGKDLVKAHIERMNPAPAPTK